MTTKILKAKIIKIRAQCNETPREDVFDAYKFKNGLVMIGTDEFLENSTELQQWGDITTVVSIEETGEEAHFTEKELLELFFPVMCEMGTYNVPVKALLSLLLLEHS